MPAAKPALWGHWHIAGRCRPSLLHVSLAACSDRHRYSWGSGPSMQACPGQPELHLAHAVKMGAGLLSNESWRRRQRKAPATAPSPAWHLESCTAKRCWKSACARSLRPIRRLAEPGASPQVSLRPAGEGGRPFDVASTLNRRACFFPCFSRPHNHVADSGPGGAVRCSVWNRLCRRRPELVAGGARRSSASASHR